MRVEQVAQVLRHSPHYHWNRAQGASTAIPSEAKITTRAPIATVIRVTKTDIHRDLGHSPPQTPSQLPRQSSGLSTKTRTQEGYLPRCSQEHLDWKSYLKDALTRMKGLRSPSMFALRALAGRKRLTKAEAWATAVAVTDLRWTIRRQRECQKVKSRKSMQIIEDQCNNNKRQMVGGKHSKHTITH